MTVTTLSTRDLTPRIVTGRLLNRTTLEGEELFA